MVIAQQTCDLTNSPRALPFPRHAWKQDVTVAVWINSNDYDETQFECIKGAFEAWNESRGPDGNASGVNFLVRRSPTRFVTLTPSAPDVDPSIQANPDFPAPTEDSPVFQVSKGVPGYQHDYAETGGGANSSDNLVPLAAAAINIDPGMTNCQALRETLSHDIGHTLKLGHCDPGQCRDQNGNPTSTMVEPPPCTGDINPETGGPTCISADLNRTGVNQVGPTPCDNNRVKTSSPPYNSTRTPTPTPTPEDPGGGGGCQAGYFMGPDGRCIPDACAECYANGGTYCSTGSDCWTPVLIDINDDGFAMTDAQNGVTFAPDSSDFRIRTGWTAPNSDDAWLVLDRNGNGMVDNGTELFGNSTPQPAPPPGVFKNGFTALAQYDRPENGGDGNGRINRQDQVFPNLRLWQDFNHNGISEPNELKPLLELDVRAIDLDYKESRRTDEFGNKFRYRARVRDTRDGDVGRWAFDVFPVSSR